MMRTALRSARTLVMAAFALALCRAALWAAGQPAGWTLPLTGMLLLTGATLPALRRFLRDQREALRLDCEKHAPINPAIASRMRLTWKKTANILGKRPQRPWYICLGQDSGRRRKLVDLAAPPEPETPTGEFACRHSSGAVWLDMDFAWDEDPGNRWPLFLEQLRRRNTGRLAGVIFTLDASLPLRDDETELRAAAGLLRQRLEQICECAAAALPVYLLVNGIDRLYGMRSLVEALDHDRLAAPLGGFRLAAREPTSGFVRRAVASAAAYLAITAAPRDATRAAAACQAPAELERLAAPLALFCSEALGEEGGADSPALRGVFLGSAGPEGVPLPSLLERLPGVVPVDEPPSPPRSWFWTELVRDLIPRDARSGRPGPGTRTGLPGLFCGTILLCWLLTWSFAESRSLLLAAAGKIDAPETVDRLEPLLELAAFAQNRNRDWWLPRFGMSEAEALEKEIKHRFIGGYFDLQTIPHVESIQDMALAAVDSQSPTLAGRVLLRLMLTRDDISRCLDANGDAPETRLFLKSLAESLKLSTPEETRRLEKFYAWAGPQDWMPATRDALVEYERFLIDGTNGGDLRWLLTWAACLPGIRPVVAASPWEHARPSGTGADRRVIDGVWTADAYRNIRSFLDAVVYDNRNPAGWRARRDAFLAEYRREALERWRAAAECLWSGFRDSIPDHLIAPLLRQAMRGEDPASLFIAQLRRHLLPMFEGEATDPDIDWLLRHQALFAPEQQATRDGDAPLTAFVRKVVKTAGELGSDGAPDNRPHEYPRIDGEERKLAAEAERQRFVSAMRRIGALRESPEMNLAAVRNQYRRWNAGAPYLPAPGEPFTEAETAAEALHRHLLESTGGGWNDLSPLAAYNYVRHLAIRLAALSLDAEWRETVYHPFHSFAADRSDPQKRLAELLDKFLNGPARGFWRLENGRLAAASWDRVPFMLAPEFLDFCGRFLAGDDRPGADSVVLSFRIDAVSVDADARERPLYAEFTVSGNGEPEMVTYRNFPASGTFTWRRGSNPSVDVDIVFSTFSLRRRFGGEQALADFVRAFDAGVWALDRDAFPGHADVLASLGINRLTLRGSFRNGEELFRETAKKPPVLPASVITPDRVGGGDDYPPGMFAHAGIREK